MNSILWCLWAKCLEHAAGFTLFLVRTLAYLLKIILDQWGHWGCGQFWNKCAAVKEQEVNYGQSNHMIGCRDWSGFNLRQINHSLIPVPYNSSIPSAAEILSQRTGVNSIWGKTKWTEWKDDGGDGGVAEALDETYSSRHSRMCLLSNHAWPFLQLKLGGRRGLGYSD